MNSFSFLHASCCPYHAAASQAASLKPFRFTNGSSWLSCSPRALPTLTPQTHQTLSERLACSAVPLRNVPGVVWEFRSHRLCTENRHSVRVSAWSTEQQCSSRHLQTDLGASQVHVPKACAQSDTAVECGICGR